MTFSSRKGLTRFSRTSNRRALESASTASISVCSFLKYLAACSTVRIGCRMFLPSKLPRSERS